jgi:hypothetical protein
MGGLIMVAALALSAGGCDTTDMASTGTSTSSSRLEQDSPAATDPATTSTAGKAGLVASKLYKAEVGLPEAYVTDRSADQYKRSKPQRIRGDLAEFALAVRARDPELADGLAWRLQAWPAAVCSIGPTVAGGFEGFVGRIDERVRAGAATASAYRVPAPALTPAGDSPRRRLVVDEARQRFCPPEGQRRGDPLGNLPKWESLKMSRVDPALVAFPYSVLLEGYYDGFPTRSVAAAYLAIAASPDGSDLYTEGLVVDVVSGSFLCSSFSPGMAAPVTKAQYAKDAQVRTADITLSVEITIAGLATLEVGCR